MLHLIRAHCFYATRAALGRHEFAHLKHSAATSASVWTFTLFAISLWLWALMSFAFDPVSVTLALVAAGCLLAASTIGLSGPHQLGMLYSVGGVCLWTAPAQYAMGGHWFLYATQAAWITLAVSQNTRRFQLLPADMKANGYTPGRD